MEIIKTDGHKLTVACLICLFYCCVGKVQGSSESATVNNSSHGSKAKSSTEALSKVYNRKLGFFSIDNSGRPAKILSSPAAKAKFSATQIREAVGEANKFCASAMQEEKKGKIKQAEQLYYKAAAIRANIWGQSDPALAKIGLHIGELEYKQGHNTAARRWFKETLSALSTHYGSGDYELVPALSQLAKLETKARNDQDAASYYDHVLSLQERKFGERAKQCQQTRISLIEELIAAKDPKEAGKNLEKAMSIEEKKGSANSQDYQKLKQLLQRMQTT